MAGCGCDSQLSIFFLPGFAFTSGAFCVSVGPRWRRRRGRCRNGKCRTVLSTGPGEYPDSLSGNRTSIFQIKENKLLFLYRNFEIFMYMREIKYVRSSEIMLYQKIPHPFPGDVCLTSQSRQKRSWPLLKT